MERKRLKMQSQRGSGDSLPKWFIIVEGELPAVDTGGAEGRGGEFPRIWLKSGKDGEGKQKVAVSLVDVDICIPDACS